MGRLLADKSALQDVTRDHEYSTGLRVLPIELSVSLSVSALMANDT